MNIRQCELVFANLKSGVNVMRGDVHDRSHATLSIRAKSPATIPMLIGGTWPPIEMRFRPFYRNATHVGIVGALF
jgi:hypothetical protein